MAGGSVLLLPFPIAPHVCIVAGGSVLVIQDLRLQLGEGTHTHLPHRCCTGHDDGQRLAYPLGSIEEYAMLMNSVSQLLVLSKC